MRKTFLNLGLVVLLGAGSLAGYTYQDRIADWYYLRSYTPPAVVAELAERATLTEDGRRIFYRSKPQIDSDRAGLVEHCRIKSDKTIELGCYLSTNQIYLLNISQPELRDEMVVTAAHEALHAAYNRMSNTERREINAQLEAAAAKITDADIKQRLAEYEELEPGEQANELHSILGTEYPNLSPSLETHYAQFFTNRSALVALAQTFNERFDGLHTQIVQLDAQIDEIKNRMQTLREAGRIREYNLLVTQVNAIIKDYNVKVALYNKYSSNLLGTQPAAGTE